MSHVELDQLLNGVSQLETADLELFAEQVNRMLAQRKVSSLFQAEAELLQQINQGLSEEVQQRYNELRAKQRAKTVTVEEHRELLVLIDRVEQADAERLQYLIALAQLHQVSLPDLMHQLGIHAPSIAEPFEATSPR